MYMVYLVLHFTFYIYIRLYLRQRGKFKEEKTQIENGWTHSRERNRDKRIDRWTDRQTDKQKDRKIGMADKKTETCHRKLKLLSQLACTFQSLNLPSKMAYIQCEVNFFRLDKKWK